jgi:hypothetical protein
VGRRRWCSDEWSDRAAALSLRLGKDVNIRSALLHEVGDTLSTAAVIAGGWAILVTGDYWIDSALSFGIGALILWSGFGIVRETLNILLEGTPRGDEARTGRNRDSLHRGRQRRSRSSCWSIGSETHALSCHIAIADIPPSVSERILRDVKDRLHHHFRIDHTTIQFEHVRMRSGPVLRCGCVMPVGESEEHQRSPQPLSEQAWLQRFVLRSSKSIWSKINREKALALIACGEMKAMGFEAIENAKKYGQWDAAYDSPRQATVPTDFQTALDANPRATAFFETLDRANRYAVFWRIQTAKKAETRARKIEQFIAMLERKEKIHP